MLRVQFAAEIKLPFKTASFQAVTLKNMTIRFKAVGKDLLGSALKRNG